MFDDNDNDNPLDRATNKPTRNKVTRNKPPGAPDPHKGRKGPKNTLDPDIAAILNRGKFVAAIPIADLNLDPSYQYIPEDESNRMNQLDNWLAEAGGFSRFLAGAIHVHEREDGSLWTLDGGGRTKMAEKEGITHIAGFVSKGLTREQESKAFVWLNTKNRVIRAPHIFVTAGKSGVEPNATICRLVEQADYVIERTTTNRKHAILGVGSLIFAHQLGPEILEMALLDLRHTWGDYSVTPPGGRPKQISGQALIAQAVVRAAGGSKFKQKRFREVMSAPDHGFHKLLAEAATNAGTYVTTRRPQSRDTTPELVKLLLGAYNKGLEQGDAKRITWDNVLALKSLFTEDEQYQDVWRWGTSS